MVSVGSYLFQRVLREGKDSRFDEMKKSFPKFFAAWMVQAVWVFVVQLPVIALNSVPVAALKVAPPATRVTDVLGLALFIGGLGFEAVADRQKDTWLQEKRAKVHDEQFITRGLWSKRSEPCYP